jgi:glutathione S-transferase
MALTLVIGNKNYSSWSLRPWIAMRNAGIAFEEILVELYTDEFRKRVGEFSPVGKVPVLIDDGAIVWESIAILEHLAEKFPGANLWPAEPKARAHARSIATEMHGGFAALRSHCPMNLRRVPKKRPTTPAEVAANVQRIDAMWGEARTRFGKGGPYLFGAFGAADAMYAPVVARIHHYDLDVSPLSRGYVDAVMALPAFQEWKTAGVKESWVMAGNEVG